MSLQVENLERTWRSLQSKCPAEELEKAIQGAYLNRKIKSAYQDSVKEKFRVR